MGSGIKKAVETIDRLPPLAIINGKPGYYVKYRIVSEDRGQASHWSPTYAVTADYEFRKPENAGVEFFTSNTDNSKIVTLSWPTVDVFINGNFIRKAIGYDVWLKWGGGDWLYAERVFTPSITVLRPTPAPSPSTLSIEVYVRSLSPSRNNNSQSLLLYSRNDMAV